MIYAITLIIETEPGEKSPDRWNWIEILDTPNSVAVVDCTPLPDDPTDHQVIAFNEAFTAAHAVVAAPDEPAWGRRERLTLIRETP